MPNGLVALLFGLCLCLKLLKIKAVEINRVQNQGREAAITYCIGQHPAGEGKEQARGLSKEEGVNLFIRDIANAEQARIAEVRGKGGACWRCSVDFDPQHDFKYVICGAFRADVELNVDIGLFRPLVNRRRIGVFEGQILHILGYQADCWLRIGAIGKWLSIGDVFGHVYIPCHDKVRVCNQTSDEVDGPRI